ncbi:MAG: hypothetical protein RL349_1275 [Bacteroidota bacterium]|jgi:hypothetical protein
MNQLKTLFLGTICTLQFIVNAQNNILYGLIRTNPASGIFLGSMDVTSGQITQISPSSVVPTYVWSGAALDLNTGKYIFSGAANTIATVSLMDGQLVSQPPINNPNNGGYFENFRFNTSDSTLYGLARKQLQGMPPGISSVAVYLASINPTSGAVTEISPQVIGQSYAGQSSAIDPHQMVYYYTAMNANPNAQLFTGLDLYNGQVFSAQPFSFPEGGNIFDNYTYNCADTSIYGIIRITTTQPQTYYFGKIDPQTGVVTRVSNQPLPFSVYVGNGSSTIDPDAGVYYFETNLPQGGYAMTGLSIATGAVVCQFPLPVNNGVFTYFDMLRHPSDCMGAAAYRPNTNGGGGSAGIENLDPNGSKVYPNPVDDQLNIESTSIIYSLILRDAKGGILFEANPQEKFTKISFEHIPSGVYFLEVQNEHGLELLKVVK